MSEIMLKQTRLKKMKKMKNRFIHIIMFSFFLGMLFYACEEELTEQLKIDLQGTPDYFDFLNEKGNLEIPIKITCEDGLKKAFYKTVDKVEGYAKPVISAENNIHVAGNTLDTTIIIPVTMNLYQIVIAVYDNKDVVNLRTIKVESVKEAPVLTFKNNISSRNTVCIGIPFNISGTVESVHDLKSVSLVPVINGVESTPIAITITDKKKVEFTQAVPVVAGIQKVQVRAENEFGGLAESTYTVKNVVNEDFISLAMVGNVTELNYFFDQEDNELKGSIASGSDIKNLKYAVTKNGVEGSLLLVTLTNPGNETDFSFKVKGEAGIQSIKIVSENEGNKSTTVVLSIPEVAIRATYLQDVAMSTDPADNKCFFSAYKTPHVYGIAEAKADQLMVDWILTKTSSGVQPVCGLAYSAGSSYYANTLPYLQGFTQLTYLYLTSKRSIVTQDAFIGLLSESDMKSYIDTYIFGPAPVGQNYNIYTSSRRVGDTFNSTSKSNGAFVIGWGSHSHPAISPSVVNNVAHALVWVKQVTQKANGHWEFVFDIKFPKADQRTANNESVIEPYEPYPL